MPREGTIRIPDRETMDNVTDLQQRLGTLEFAVREAYDYLLLIAGGSEARTLMRAYTRADNALAELGLMGDTAELATYGKPVAQRSPVTQTADEIDEELTRATEALTQLADHRDIEAAHAEADDTLCQVLRLVGMHDLVEAYDRVPKWYA